jgi:hypothetical protein
MLATTPDNCNPRIGYQAAAATSQAVALILLVLLLLSLWLFLCRMEALDNCQLDIMLLYEVVYDEVMKVMFPINSMRNYALLQWLLDKQK